VGYKSENSKNQNYDTADLVIHHFDELKVERIRIDLGLIFISQKTP
jgi:hypothetical protein